MSPETKQWLEALVKTGSLSAEELKVFEAAATKADSFIKDTTLTRSDYSRSQDALKAEREKLTTEYQQKLDAVRTYQQQLADYDGKNKKEVEAANARYIKAAEALATLKAKALANNLTVEELETMTAQVTHQPETSKVEQTPAKRNLTEDDLPAYALQMAQLYAGLNDLALKHKRLYGSDLEVAPLLSEAQAANKPLLEYYNTKYNPGAKEEELRQASMKAEIDRQVAEKLNEWKSQNPLAAPSSEEKTHLFDDISSKPQHNKLDEYKDSLAALEVFKRARAERIEKEQSVFGR